MIKYYNGYRIKMTSSSSPDCSEKMRNKEKGVWCEGSRRDSAEIGRQWHRGAVDPLSPSQGYSGTIWENLNGYYTLSDRAPSAQPCFTLPETNHLSVLSWPHSLWEQGHKGSRRRLWCGCQKDMGRGGSPLEPTKDANVDFCLRGSSYCKSEKNIL